MSKTLWIDVEDLLDYGTHTKRPTGIQRVTFEMYRALHRNYGDTGRINFIRRDYFRNSFTVVPWETIAGLFNQLTDGDAPKPFVRTGMRARSQTDRSNEPRLRVWARRMLYRLPPDLRQPPIRFFLAQRQAILLQRQAIAALGAGFRLLFFRVAQRVRHCVQRSGWRSRAARPPAVRDEFARRAKRGDIFVVLGAPWSSPEYPMLVTAYCARHGLEFALLLYDIIPIRRPEWLGNRNVALFRTAYATLLPVADTLFAISRATADDVERYAKENGIVLRSTVQVVPIGTTLESSGPRAAGPVPRLPAPGSFVLFVSTIEPRKNHILLFRVWRRLLEEMPAEQVPVLVFAGQIGWLVDDFMQQLENANYLDGKIRLIEDPSDSELDALYRDCLFTLFPSLYEGWGLPVTESLARGKPCISSDRTSLPEAGGTLARYFDPENLADAYAVIRATIEDREGLRAWESEIVRRFRTIPWDATVAALLHGLDNPIVSGMPLSTFGHAPFQTVPPPFYRLTHWRQAWRLRRRLWSRIREEWATNGWYGVRRLIARRIPASWLRRLIDPFAQTEVLAAAGRLDDAIAFYRAKLGLLAEDAPRSLPARKTVWVDFADLLVVNGQLEEAGRIYERVNAIAPEFLSARQGMENLRRRKGEVSVQSPLNIHFFTIVLNGMPFIKAHIDEMLKLPFDWHWHIVEGIASLSHDTAWSVANGGHIESSLHRDGLSNDGTTEYLDHLAELHPHEVTVYRKHRGDPWDGKIEMVRAPLAKITEECLLWQIDVDEFWTAEQFMRTRQKFVEDPERTAAFFLCYFFFRNLVVTTANTYGNHLEYEWLRVWRYRPGDYWLSHEPPRLCRRLGDGNRETDLGALNPFAHGETLRDNLVFRHVAYVLPSQLRFKEIYYGYKNALEQWQSLPATGPVRLREYLSWITDGATADDSLRYDIAPPAPETDGAEAGLAPTAATPSLYRAAKSGVVLSDLANILVVKLDNIGDAVLLSPFLRELRRNAPQAKITLMVQPRVYDLVASCPRVDRVVPAEIGGAAGAFRCRDKAFLASYGGGGFDLAVVPRWDVDESSAGLIARNSGARHVIGFGEGVSRKKARENRGYDGNYTELLTKISPDHEVVQNLALLRFMNGTVESDRLEAWIGAGDEARATALLKPLDDNEIIAVCPGASHIGKVLPTSMLVRILDAFAPSLRFVVLGTAGEGERAALLSRHFGERALPLCGETNLREALAILKRCRAAVTMDSALAHLAASVATPVVVFSMHPRDGGNDTLDLAPARFGPWCPDDRRLIVQPDRAWPGCETGCRWRDVRPHCIGNIDYTDAIRRVGAFLERQGIGSRGASL